MQPLEKTVVSLRALASLSLLLLVAGGCGTGTEEGVRHGSLVGGVLRPQPVWYALAPTSDPIVPVGGACDVDASIRPLPSSVDLRRDGIIPPVPNQRWNSCVAWTFGYYVMTAVEARRRLREAEQNGTGDAVDITDPQNWFSPDFIYSQRDTLEERRRTAPTEPNCFELDRAPTGEFELACMRPEKALRLLIERGACKWPWMCTDPVTDEYAPCVPDDRLVGNGPIDVLLANANLRSRRVWRPSAPGAEVYKPRSYVRFGSLDGRGRDQFPILDMQAWLQEQGTPIAIIVQMMDGWLTYREGSHVDVVRPGFPCDVIEKRGACLDAGAVDLGSQHMMTIIGYDNDFPSRAQYPGLSEEKRGSFLIVNQYGTKWGDRGYMWIPYSELRRIWIAGYGIIGDTPGANVRPDGITRTVCGAIASECNVVVVEEHTQDLQGGWDNLGEADDVPRNIGQGGGVVTSAPPLTPGVTPVTSLPAGDPGDWYQFEVTGPNTLVELELVPTLGTCDIKLTDSELRRIGGSAIPGSYSDHITRNLEPGTYFVKVCPDDGSDSAYTLELAVSPPAEVDDDIGGAGEIDLTEGGSSYPGGGGKPTVASSRLSAVVEGSLSQIDTCDWWAVTVPETSTVEIQLLGVTDGVGLEVWRGESPDSATLVGRALAASCEFVGIDAIPETLWDDALASVPSTAGDRLFLRAYTEFGRATTYLIFVDTVTEVDTDDTPAGATPLAFTSMPPRTANGPFLVWSATAVGRVDDTDPRDYYRFMAPGGTRAFVSFSSAGAGSDSMVIVSSVGELAGGTLCSGAGDFTLDVPADGQDHPILLVVSWLGDDTDYTLGIELEFDESPALDGMTATNARTLVPGLRLQSVVGGSDLDDWYRLPPGGDVPSILTLTDFCQELEVQLVNETTGAVLPTSDAGSTAGTQRRRLTLSAVDPLWVRLASANGQTTGYTLRLGAVAGSAVPRGGVDGNNTPQDAAQPPMRLGESRPGRIDLSDARDYWLVEVDSPAGGNVPVVVDLSFPAADLRLSAWDGNGRLLGSSDQDNAFVPGERLEFEVPAGTRVLLLVDEGPDPDAGGDYELRVNGGVP